MADTTDIVATTLRLPRDLRQDVRVEAAKEGKSSNEWMVEALRLVVKRVRASA